MSDTSSDSGSKGPASPSSAGGRPAPTVDSAAQATTASSSLNATRAAAAASGNQPGNGNQFFGAALGPVLQEVCGGRLAAISWFRADWQRGGALTGYSIFTEDGRKAPVVVKLPVPPVELHWLGRLQAAADVVPRVYAAGETLGGYDMAWVVMERLQHGPLGSAWGGREFDLLVEVAGRFYAAGGPTEGGGTERRDWIAIAQLSRRAVQEQSLPETARWKEALKKAQKTLPVWLERWNSRPRRDYCHGDLHFGNAMTRVPAPAGPAILLDFAEVHPGHWVEDAVYLEHLYWGSPQRLGPHKPARDLAQQRKKLGLTVESDWHELANIKRASWPWRPPRIYVTVPRGILRQLCRSSRRSSTRISPAASRSHDDACPRRQSGH